VSLLCQKETVQVLSAFESYQFEAIHLLERATSEAVCCYCGVAHSILRIALEALVRGAFWEGMAHKAPRDRAEVVRRSGGVKIEGEVRGLHRWFRDVFSHAPQAEGDLERTWGAIFDRTSRISVEYGICPPRTEVSKKPRVAHERHPDRAIVTPGNRASPRPPSRAIQDVTFRVDQVLRPGHWGRPLVAPMHRRGTVRSQAARYTLYSTRPGPSRPSATKMLWLSHA